MRIIISFLFLLLSDATYAADAETLVYGAARRPDGRENIFVVEQPDNLQNPLGDPIIEPQRPTQVFGQLPQKHQNSEGISDQPDNVNNQNSPALESKALGKDFQNTLLEANGRVYDVQSFPEQDMNIMSNPAEPETIYSPNVNGS